MCLHRSGIGFFFSQNVICLVNSQNGSWVLFTISQNSLYIEYRYIKVWVYVPAINPVNTYLQDISTIVVNKSLKKWCFLFSTWRLITFTSPWALINRFRSFFKFSIKFGVKNEPDRLVLGFICSIGGISGATLEFIFKLRFSCNLSLFCLQSWIYRYKLLILLCLVCLRVKKKMYMSYSTAKIKKNFNFCA